MKRALHTLGWVSFVLTASCAVVEDPAFLYEPADDGLNSSIAAGEGATALAREPLPLDEEGCPGIFAQDLLPSFEITLEPSVMAALYDDWIRGVERNVMDIDETIYRPVTEFRYGDLAVTDAMIRLRGNPRFWLEQNKMQFQISFDEHDKSGRFLGQRKLLFDAATYNRHFLRDRLSLWIMRQAGISAPCANNARLYINGDYYGLFTSLEKLDEVFLERVFPGHSHGDLWKRRNYELKTNTKTSTDERLKLLRALVDDSNDGRNGDVNTLAQYLDIEQVLRVYAVDAILPNSDGPWAGGLNFYLYDDPASGKFLLLPWDLDNTFTRLTPNTDPYTYKKDVRYHGRPIYNTILADDAWFQRYVEIIDEVLTEVYQHEGLWALTGNGQRLPLDDFDLSELGDWSRQLREAALTDINKPFHNDRLEDRRSALARFLRDREIYLTQWVQCWKDGGVRDQNGECVPQ